ncbi:hypothetical protein [Alteromonas sp. PRIM-21]|uniref:hypothetical protein n=1 Tax=Alteromonas sp. PRIM-21 TaxID=1454978 RepID=UPI0022B96073|nr:hypothetical protein [Alteromonas sp. PRIM-21]MCZ8531612.1 hypothetical protein [Alteromonas sp. PRIM-21]
MLSSESKFYLLFSLFITFVVIGGFALHWSFNPSSLSRVSMWIGLHGTFSAAWYLLLINQIRLSSTGKYSAHKTLGKLSVFIVIGILVTGSVMVLEFYHRMAGFGVFNPEDAEARIRAGSFLGGVFLQWLIFLILYILGILNIKNQAHHKRLMIAAAIIMMPEGLNRAIHVLTLPSYSMYIFMSLIYTVLIFYDWKTKKRLYVSTFSAVVLFCVLVVAMNTLFKSQAWGDFAVKAINVL